jgi:maltooligosyltrehalose synthase
MSDVRTPSPRGTYRLQLKPGFGFPEAAAIAPYLEAQGFKSVIDYVTFQFGARVGFEEEPNPGRSIAAT